MDITKAQFWNIPNLAGRESFSYAALLAQLTADLPSSNPNFLKGLMLRASETMTLLDGFAQQLDWNDGGSGAIIEFEDFNFYSDSDSTVLATIPDVDPPITRVMTYGSLFIGGTAGVRAMAHEKNLNNQPGAAAQDRRVPSSNATFISIWSGIWEVVVGDKMSIEVTVSGAGGNQSGTNIKGGLLVVG